MPKRVHLVHFILGCMLFMVGCGGGAHQESPGTVMEDAGADAAEEAADAAPEVGQDAAEDVVPDVAAEADAPLPTLTVSSDPSLIPTTEYRLAKYAEVLDLILTADHTTDLDENLLCLTRHGMGANSDIVSVTLLDQDFMRYTLEDKPLDPTTGKVCFTGLDIKYPAGKATRVRVMVHFQAPATGSQHQFSVDDPADIGLVQAADIQGAFPINGPTILLGNTMNPELIYAYSGPDATVPFQAGDQEAPLLELSGLAVRHKLMVMAQHLFLVSRDGGLVRGTQGTFYLDDIRLWDGDTPIGQPYAMDDQVAWGENAVYFDLTPALQVVPNDIAQLRITASLKSTEDAPGEFFGHTYSLAIKLPGMAADVTDLTFADVLDPGQISPQDDIEGSLRLVQTP